MVNTKEVKLKVDVGKVLSLKDSDIISDKDAEALLNQFSKEDLVEYLLSNEVYEDEEDLEDEELDDELASEEEQDELIKKFDSAEDQENDEEPDDEGDEDEDLDEEEDKEEDLEDLDL